MATAIDMYGGRSPSICGSRKRRRRGGSDVIGINLVPAIDVTFNLLIFFVVATTFKAPEGLLPSELPVEQGVLSATPLPVSPIRVRIRQQGDDPAQCRLTVDNLKSVPENFAELTAMLEDLTTKPGFGRDTPVVLVPEQGVQWDHVVNAFNAVRRVNLSKGPEHTFKSISFSSGG